METQAEQQLRHEARAARLHPRPRGERRRSVRAQAERTGAGAALRAAGPGVLDALPGCGWSAAESLQGPRVSSDPRTAGLAGRQ